MINNSERNHGGHRITTAPRIEMQKSRATKKEQAPLGRRRLLFYVIACKLQYGTERRRVEGTEGGRWYLHTGDRESAVNVYDIRIMRAWVFLLRHTAYTCQPKRPDLSEADLSPQTHIHARAGVYTRASSDRSPKEALCRWHRELRIRLRIWVHRSVELSSKCHSDSFFPLPPPPPSNLVETIPFWPNKRTNTHAPRINYWAAFDAAPTSSWSTLSVCKIVSHSVEFIGVSRILRCESCDATEGECGQSAFVYPHF